MELYLMAVLAFMIVAAAAAYAYGRVFEHAQVMEYERGLLYQNGRYLATLGPGRHRLIKPFLHQELVRVGMRRVSVSVPGQEVLTKDRLPLRLTVIAQYKIADPAAAINSVENYLGTLYEEIQLELRAVVGEQDLEDLLAKKEPLSVELLARARAKAAAYGVELLACAVKDVALPGAIKDILLKAEEARQEARARLITAREELAATRCRVNSAKLMSDNPVLLRLKELETLAELAKRPGSTIVLPGLSELAAKLK